MTKFDYITVAPITPKGKWTVCSRRIGTKDRFAQIAVANTELAAGSIVDALNLMQGEVKKLEVPAQRLLEQVRADLRISQQRCRDAETAKSGTEQRYREEMRRADEIRNERDKLRVEIAALKAQLKVPA